MKFNRMTKEGLIEVLTKLVQKLDDLDGEDFFGSEGWRRFLELEDDL